MATTELARSPNEQPSVARRAIRPLPESLTGDNARAVLRSWLVSRGVTLCLLTLWEATVSGDASYYARNLHLLSTGNGVREVLQEYPLPVLLIMLPQYALGGLTIGAFSVLFGASMLAVDGGFTALLWRRGGRRRGPALRFWLWFLPLLGPMVYFRFDLVPAVLVGCALLAALRRPVRAGVLTACGAALKLWPAVMLPILLLRRRGRVALVAGFVATGVVAVVGSLAVGGTGRLLSPVRWQDARGLQIESVPATPLLLGHAVHPRGLWHVDISRYKSYDVFGTGVPATVDLTSALMAAALVLLAWLWLRAYRLPAVSATTIAWLVFAAAVLLTVTNKILSPQYLLWLGGPLAILLLLAPGDAAARRAGRGLLVIAVLTQLIYPTLYPKLIHVQGLTLVTTLLLAARNVGLIWLAWHACRQVWRRTAR